MTDVVRNPGGIPLSAGQVQAAIEAAVRREVERYRRRHGRPWGRVVDAWPEDHPYSRTEIIRDVVNATERGRQDLMVPPPRHVALRGLVLSMLRLAQRMGGIPGEVTY